MEYIALGQYGPLADSRARIAMNHAFDIKGYITGIERRHRDYPSGVFPTTAGDQRPVGDQHPYDLAKAKQLFRRRGCTPGTN